MVTERFIVWRGDEHDPGVQPAARQFQLKIWTTHAWQADIEDQAARLAGRVGLEQRLSRRKRLYLEAGVQQQDG